MKVYYLIFFLLLNSINVFANIKDPRVLNIKNFQLNDTLKVEFFKEKKINKEIIKTWKSNTIAFKIQLSSNNIPYLLVEINTNKKLSKKKLHKSINYTKSLVLTGVKNVFDFSSIIIRYTYFSKEQKERITAEFSIINYEVIPIAPNCNTKLSVDLSEKCTHNFIKTFLRNNINKEVFDSYKKGKYKLILKFSIDKNGNFIYHNPFEGMILVHIEIGRISKLLPKFSPGIKNGHKIRVNYSLPFFITKRK